jgi:Glutamine amidotransferase domain
MMIAGIKPENLSKVHTLAKFAAKHMSIVEDDGVGYAAITKDGGIYGEKWRNKEDAFAIHSQPKPDPVVTKMQSLIGLMGEWGTALATTKIYDSFGYRTKTAVDNTVALILHARKASMNSSKTIENVHPFSMIDVEDQPDTALIHNGLIVNHDKLVKTMSSCDSEVILHEYLANVMYHNPWGMEQLAKTLVGEYACGVLSSGSDDNNQTVPILDVFKSGKELYCLYIPEIDANVFCTSDYTMKNAAQEAGFTVLNPVKLKDGYLARFNAITGERIGDLISFTTSNRYDNAYYKSHNHSMAGNRGMGPRHIKNVAETTKHLIDDITATKDDNIESIKKHFERKHPSLFTAPYGQPEADLAANEKALFNTLKENNNTNHKALHLVQAALGFMNRA